MRSLVKLCVLFYIGEIVFCHFLRKVTTHDSYIRFIEVMNIISDNYDSPTSALVIWIIGAICLVVFELNSTQPNNQKEQTHSTPPDKKCGVTQTYIQEV